MAPLILKFIAGWYLAIIVDLSNYNLIIRLKKLLHFQWIRNQALKKTHRKRKTELYKA
jgi:hypothetical protein